MKRALKILVRIYEGFISGLVYVSVALILFMLLCICASVLLRQTPYALGWELEASEYILILITFFGTGWLMRTGGHTRVDMLPNVFKGRTQDLYNGFSYSVVAAVCLALLLIGIDTTWDAFAAGIQQVKVYTFPKWILIAVIPFGCIFLLVESVKLAIRNFGGKLILVVDDEVDVIDSLKEMIKGYRVHEALDFDTATEKLKRNIYDVVILDIMGVQGLDLLEMSAKRGFPTLMLTAHAINPEALKECMTRGAVSFIPKEEISNITTYLSDAITRTRGDARVNFYQRLGPYFDFRFGPGWDQGEPFWAEARKILGGKEA